MEQEARGLDDGGTVLKNDAAGKVDAQLLMVCLIFVIRRRGKR